MEREIFWKCAKEKPKFTYLRYSQLFNWALRALDSARTMVVALHCEAPLNTLYSLLAVRVGLLYKREI